ncbi:hypothetical protein BS78_K341800 [Paspalum vaginatum]|uniref:Uncharacterized protein n=1 Tax=Paspalum vaginatum TaxID=158149 RepID=A0A9W7XDF3_9POAL|nr:hypothetical protein BS78_K341800 [Paspalum vaginatum]
MPRLCPAAGVFGRPHRLCLRTSQSSALPRGLIFPLLLMRTSSEKKKNRDSAAIVFLLSHYLRRSDMNKGRMKCITFLT